MSGREILSVAAELGIPESAVESYGRDRAKIALDHVAGSARRGKLILVSAITPTPAGEGKTTTSIALAQGLRHLGHRAALALREPSMGPVFGRKGGATGGGQASLIPSDRINLHFNGDFHAVTAAHNLLASVIDNRLHFRDTRLAPERVLWKRVLDTNDRALRNVVVNAGAKDGGRTTGFDITAASEVMAILCLAESMDDLRTRLDRILVGFDRSGGPVFAGELGVTGALLALLRDALQPNLVQSLEGVPAVLHGGPFANIAHGCNSVLATRTALAGADHVITEAGFAFDLGGEKFQHIKCRASGLAPDVIVLVATVRALKMHGGTPLDALAAPDPAAVERGLENLGAHLDAAARFARPLVIALNAFPTDTAEEVGVVRRFGDSRGVRCVVSRGYAEGGPGGAELAEAVLAAETVPSPPLPALYDLEHPIEEKIDRITRLVYGGDGVDFTEAAREKLDLARSLGADRLPVCMAKTQNSLSDDPTRLGRPRNFRITVRDLEFATGAGFVVALTGTLLRMPALPRRPAAEGITVDATGRITGLMAG
jgi:formate--tetrahydrofolate ligase